MPNSLSLERWITALAFVSLAAYALVLSAVKPFHNWDTIGYIAVAESYEQPDVHALHAFTYAALQRALPPAQFEDLAQGPGAGRWPAYRRTVYTDDTVFAEQLAFYRVRPAYTGLVFALYKLGVDIEFATHFVSGLAAAAGLMLLYAAAMARSRGLGLLLAPAAVLFGVLDLARFSTPDALAFCAVMLAAWLLLRGHLRSLLVLLPLALCARTDLVLFTAPLLAGLFLAMPQARMKILAAAAGSALVYLAIVTLARNPGWSTFFYCSAVQRCLHPVSEPPSVSADQYFGVLHTGTTALMHDPLFFMYLAMLAAFAVLVRPRRGDPRWHSIIGMPAMLLAATASVYVAARFLVYPAEWNRFFTAPYLVMTLALVVVLDERARTRLDPVAT